MELLKIMVVDDHSLIRTGLRLLFKGCSDIVVTAEASTAEEALEKMEKQAADLMILDISMPGMGGLQCIAEAKRRWNNLKIIVLTMHEDENYIRKAMKAGANGYIPKASADDELMDAVRIVASGRFYLSRNAEQSLLGALYADDNMENPVERLSPREAEVFGYLIHGYTITEIGEKLQLSVKTIDTHKTKIMEKLQCKKRSELVTLALKYNLLHNQETPHY